MDQNQKTPESALAWLNGWVKPIQGEPLRFMVDSRRPSVPAYLVDLEEHGFNGACHCEHFRFRLEPLLLRGSAASPALRCWHIKIAREMFLEGQLRLMSKIAAGRPASCPMRCCPLHGTCKEKRDDENDHCSSVPVLDGTGT